MPTISVERTCPACTADIPHHAKTHCANKGCQWLECPNCGRLCNSTGQSRTRIYLATGYEEGRNHNG